MDARRVLVFRTVGHAGSLAAAARELGWTQPAVSQQVRRLERELGTPLVVRIARGIVLTDAGRALLRHADAIAGQLTIAGEEISAVAGLRAGRVRLASFPSAAATVVPAALAAVLRAYPAVDVRLVEVEPAEALDLLDRDDCDAAVVFDYDDAAPLPAEFLTVPILREPVRAVVQVGHPAAGSDPLPLGALHAERWVAGCPRCRRHLLAAAAAAGFVPDIRHQTDDYLVAQNLVAAGLAVTLLPRMALQAAQARGLAVLPLSSAAERQVSLVLRRDAASVPLVAVVLRELAAAAAALDLPTAAVDRGANPGSAISGPEERPGRSWTPLAARPRLPRG